MRTHLVRPALHADGPLRFDERDMTEKADRARVRAEQQTTGRTRTARAVSRRSSSKYSRQRSRSPTAVAQETKRVRAGARRAEEEERGGRRSFRQIEWTLRCSPRNLLHRSTAEVVGQCVSVAQRSSLVHLLPQ